ncbi:MAG: polysaccharide deacetylase family protein [Thermodesulfobacteriota bacterium]|nr:polysaccharide deacetylase family protein [Thermodesulfobacteriota bacterium]
MPVHIFEQQMKYLDENGYRVITFAQLIDFLEYHQALPKKAVIISIDDGYRSVYEVGYPILKKYGFTATLFVYTNFVGSCRNAITWNQLARMKANGFEIGSHTLSHSDLTKRKVGEDTQAYLARVENELRVSKEIIDKNIGQETIFLAFPYGRFNKNVLEISERLGYRAAVTVKKDEGREERAEQVENYRNLGIELFKDKEYQAAIAEFNKVLNVNPDDKIVLAYLSNTHLRHGIILFEKEDYLEAEKKFEASYRYNKNCQKCQDYIKKSQETYKKIHYNRGLSYFGKQQLPEAIREWELVHAVDPNYKEVEKNIKKAKTLLERLEQIKKSLQEPQT